MAEATKKYLSIPQAAKFLSCSTNSIRRMIARNHLPAHRFPGSRIIRLNVDDLHTFMEIDNAEALEARRREQERAANTHTTAD